MWSFAETLPCLGFIDINVHIRFLFFNKENYDGRRARERKENVFRSWLHYVLVNFRCLTTFDQISFFSLSLVRFDNILEISMKISSILIDVYVLACGCDQKHSIFFPSSISLRHPLISFDLVICQLWLFVFWFFSSPFALHSIYGREPITIRILHGFHSL